MSRSKSKGVGRGQLDVTGKPRQHLEPASTSKEGVFVPNAAVLRARKRKDGLTVAELNKKINNEK